MIEVKKVSKRFESLVVLNNVSFTVREAQIVVVLGPSGTGKTVLLKSIIGLQNIDAGDVIFDGISVHKNQGNQHLYDIRRKIGFVFQGTALFDSMNVSDNIALPLNEHTHLKKQEIRKRVVDILSIIGLEGKEHLYPMSLSGGMKRLVAVGRALALDPIYLFYDEPTTGLDPIMRDRVVRLIIDLKIQYGKSGIVVTHDLDTAQAVGDDVYMLKQGRISKLQHVGKEEYNA
ncbi:ATP-binding cassette domain-containing protein [candidate division WOR-3 bacterium]|nr:ATP-binding cassette domain-containing protein [candidate division WOR-3 bacterium]